MIGLFMAIERAYGLTQSRPDAVIIDASGHDQDQDLVLANLGRLDDLDLHGLGWAAMTLLADRPCMHAGRDMIGRRNLADLIEVL